MSELLKWLSTNPVVMITLLIAFFILIVLVILVYLVAFFQGREISFWPPKIGPKPKLKTITNVPKDTSANGVFGIKYDEKITIVRSRYPKDPLTESKEGTKTFEELRKILLTYGHSEKLINSVECDKVSERIGQEVEFCIGGPEANTRTKKLLERYIQRIARNPYSPNTAGHIAFCEFTKDGEEKHRWPYIHNEKEHAILAKIGHSITKEKGSKPIFLFCGQTGRANRGALRYLKRELN